MSLRLFALAPLAILAACATTPPAPQADTAAVISMTSSLTFNPTPVTIKVGQTVEFQNASAFAHTVSTKPSTPDEAADTALPNGAVAFDSGSIKGGGTFRQTFTVPGTYKYFCDPHHGAGMTGTIIVTN